MHKLYVKEPHNYATNKQWNHLEISNLDSNGW